jgi:hypothetical protein
MNTVVTIGINTNFFCILFASENNGTIIFAVYQSQNDSSFNLVLICSMGT